MSNLMDAPVETRQQRKEIEPKKRSWRKILLRVFGVFLVLLIAGGAYVHTTIMSMVNSRINLEVKFGDELNDFEDSDFIVNGNKNEAKLDDSNFVPLEKASPFREIEVFDDDAKNWGIFGAQYATCGLLLFDANGDDKMDAYFCNPGDNWVRPTDSKGVLMDKPRRQHNALFINLGNDEKGDPIYKQVKEIAKANDTYIKEELLIENYLYPRESLDDDEERTGRTSHTAISIDLNGDGLQDLIVANALEGQFWSHEKTQRVLGQFVRPVGRQANNVSVPLTNQGQAFIKDYVPRDNTNDVRKSSRGEEPCGSNSVYLNMGDKDNDGLPEWKDVTNATGLGGKRASIAIVSADFDLDGDLDIFEANVMDPDLWPGGATQHAGAPNQLYMNQLAETGELTFIEKAAEMDVDNLFDEDNPEPELYKLKVRKYLPFEYSLAFMEFEPYRPGWLEVNGDESEHGDISWTATVADANDDGWPDIWVANDLGFLRLYINDEGKRFIKPDKYVRNDQVGSWMSFSCADFNGDLKEDIFGGNVGGAFMNASTSVPTPAMMVDPVILNSVGSQQFYGTNTRTMHAIFDGSDYTKEIETVVKHSKVLPPDVAIPNNVKGTIPGGRLPAYDINSLDPYEFSWGSTVIDVQNDGKEDIYWIGCLYGAGGGIYPMAGTGPGRLMVNATPDNSKEVNLVDMTAEYNVFNILEMKYDKLEEEGYIYRKSPTKNWGKRSMVYSHDYEIWGLQGPSVLQKVKNSAMIQCAEEGRSVVAADINNDGFQDIVLRNLGGYDSRKSTAVNLKANIDGKVHVLPAHDANFPTPSNFEPGDSRVFINTHTKGNHVKVNLVDNSNNAFNTSAIGAKVVINDRHLMVKRAGTGGFISNYSGPLHYGIADETVTKIEVRWPDRDHTVEVFKIDNLVNGTVWIEKGKGVVRWKPTEKTVAPSMAN